LIARVLFELEIEHTSCMEKFDGFEITWAEDGLSAYLRPIEEAPSVRLRVEQWFPDQQLEGQPAWIASWLDPTQEEPTMLEAPIEQPALVAEDDQRRRHLTELAIEASRNPPPKIPEPFAAPGPTPEGADEWADHHDLQLISWDEAFGELVAACGDMSEAGELRRYRSLTQALDWAYALDSSLNLLWKQMLPEEVREDASKQTDERAQRAAKHNAESPLKFNLDTDPAFSGYVERLKDHQPYSHWGEVMLAGVFQARFFLAIGWVRGQLIHAATSAPLELRQFRPGVAPRWKWRESEEFFRGRASDPGRKAYERLLAGGDVIGLLSHLTEVFHEAGMYLRKLLRNSEAGAL
jgi:hypothetical protein